MRAVIECLIVTLANGGIVTWLQPTIGLGVVGGFEKRPPGTEAQLKN